jgi:hypothetical protein
MASLRRQPRRSRIACPGGAFPRHASDCEPQGRFPPSPAVAAIAGGEGPVPAGGPGMLQGHVLGVVFPLGCAKIPFVFPIPLYSLFWYGA